MVQMFTARVVKPFHLPSGLHGKWIMDANICGLVSSNFFIMT